MIGILIGDCWGFINLCRIWFYWKCDDGILCRMWVDLKGDFYVYMLVSLVLIKG